MIRRTWSLLAALACFCAAWTLQPPRLDDLREFAAWLVRPAALPFAWRSLAEARDAGDAGEMFARAQHIMQLLPSWTDGHIVFACRFATDGGSLTAPPAERAAAAQRRLQIALLWLESARAAAGRRETELLQAMAMLPELAVAQEPGLAELLRPEGGAAALADHYLAEAERLGQSRSVREKRTFLAPLLCAGYLDSGERQRAINVLDVAIGQSAGVRDRALAAEWCARLAEVRSALLGEPVDLTAVRADARFAGLLHHLR